MFQQFLGFPLSRQSIRRFNCFHNWKISRLFQQFFGFLLQGIYPLFQFFSQMENLTVSTNFLVLHCKQSIRRFNSFLKREIKPLFQQFLGVALQVISPFFQFFCQMEIVSVVSTIVWPCIVSNLSAVSILLSNRQSNRCFNKFLASHYR